MLLADWLNERGRSVTRDVSESLKIHPRSLRRIARREYHPSFELAARISAATDGQVTIEDLLGELPAGAVWSMAQAEAESLARVYGALLSAEERELLEESSPYRKRPMKAPGDMRGAA